MNPAEIGAFISKVVHTEWASGPVHSTTVIFREENKKMFAPFFGVFESTPQTS
jgi:hypothetical protein